MSSPHNWPYARIQPALSDPPRIAPPATAPRPEATMAAYRTHLLIGGLIPPVLLGLLAARLVADGFRQAGHLGEQLLQGQRLPHLQMHD